MKASVIAGTAVKTESRTGVSIRKSKVETFGRERVARIQSRKFNNYFLLFLCREVTFEDICNVLKHKM